MNKIKKILMKLKDNLFLHVFRLGVFNLNEMKTLNILLDRIICGVD